MIKSTNAFLALIFLNEQEKEHVLCYKTSFLSLYILCAFTLWAYIREGRVFYNPPYRYN
ncbi:MAG: hypothetical protein ACK4K9_01220 [Bacteroidia bacterium]